MRTFPAFGEDLIEDNHTIVIKAPPVAVYMHLEEMETKFPIYSFLDSRPFIALRLILIGEPKTGFKMLLRGRKHFQKLRGKRMKLGDYYGPFKLIEAIEGKKYWFELRTKLRLFDLKAGYLLEPAGEGTLLSLSLLSSNPNSMQRLYWRLIKPAHMLFSKKVLSTIKAEVEAQKPASIEFQKLLNS